MKKIFPIILILVFAVACSTHIHTVGTGPSSGQEEKARQWYALYGLIPINKVDTNTMAGRSSNYEIKTSTTFGDFLVSLIPSMVTVSCRTVKVTK